MTRCHRLHRRLPEAGGVTAAWKRRRRRGSGGRALQAKRRAGEAGDGLAKRGEAAFTHYLTAGGEAGIVWLWRSGSGGGGRRSVRQVVAQAVAERRTYTEDTYLRFRWAGGGGSGEAGMSPVGRGLPDGGSGMKLH